MNESNEMLRKALALAKRAPLEALAVLDEAMTLAKSTNESRSVASLAKHAAVISESAGDLARARAYYGEAIRVAPDDALLHFAYGEQCARFGSVDEAAQAFDLGAGLASAQGLVDVVEMIDRARVALRDGA